MKNSMTDRIEELKETKKYYSELRGDSPSYEEIVLDRDDIYVQEYKPMPVTFGFEIEQPSWKIRPSLRGRYEWHFDGSGPYETALSPSVYPGRRIHHFIRDVKETRSEWVWASQMESRGEYVGCGSHIHFRVREDLPQIYCCLLDAWSTTFNTLVEVTPLILPMFAWGGIRRVYTFRRSLFRWASFSARRYTPREVGYYLSEHYTGREYDSITWNRKHGAKPLTIEIRLNETHPAFAYEAAIILNRIIRKCIERGFVSPKLRNRTDTFDKITESIRRSIYNYEDLYSALERVENISFLRLKEIPNLKSRYRNYLELFDDILINYGHPYPPMGRVCDLFLRRGYPYLNADAVWNTFVPFGEFSWNQPELGAERI